MGTEDDTRKKLKNGFEEVPPEEFSSDTDAQAEQLAMGALMIRKKSREAMIDAAYSRYAFNDHDNLPSWFTKNERRHNKPILPITKEMVNSFKEQLKAINSRPIKKLAEAKARKRLRAVAAWEKLKSKADIITQAGDGE